MPTLRDRFVSGVRGLLHPERFGRSESQVLAEVYDDNNAKQMERGQWVQHVNQSGIRTGFTFNCNCGTSYRILEAEKFRDYTCAQCKKPLNFAVGVGLKLSKSKDERAATLKKFAGILAEADWVFHQSDGDWLPPDKQEQVLSLLPLRPSFARETGGPRVIDTWKNDSDGGVEYEQSDPGVGGSFSNPR
jgi:hypothetical protein